MNLQQAFIFNHGKHYVCYPDGKESKVMPKHIAKSYASIFGGTVHRHSAFPTLRQRLVTIYKQVVK